MSNKDFKHYLFGNQYINLEDDQANIKIKSGISHENQLIDVLSLPLITFNRNEKIYADTFEYNQKSKNLNKLVLNKKFDDKISITLEISPFSQNENHPWIKFQLRMKFLTNWQFKKDIPEIQMEILPWIQKDLPPVYINQPTLHTPPTNEWKSNDMPASFIWNPRSKIATLFFLNFTSMEWMSSDNIERFSYYKCGFDQINTFGLLQRVPLKNSFIFPSECEINFEFYLKHFPLPQKPSKWDAVDLLIISCFDLIPASVPFAKNDINWVKFSKGCIDDLMKENLCWRYPERPLYHAYVMDKSEFQRRKDFGKNIAFETMTILDILPPWMVYLRFFPNQDQKKHIEKTILSVKSFIDPNTNYLYNNVILTHNQELTLSKPSQNSIGDSWYFFEPIVRYGWLIRLLQIAKDKEQVVEEFLAVFKTMVTYSEKFVSNHSQEITAFYDPFSLKPFSTIQNEDPNRWALLQSNRGRNDLEWKKIAKNYACLGIYIYILMQAYYFFNDREFLEQAEKSSLKFMEMSPDELFWEPLELAYGVSGFTELYKVTKNRTYLQFAKRIIHNELRMFYWYEDNTLNWKGKRRIIGFPMACVGIRYPAMKENLESIYPWTTFLKYAIKNDYNDLISVGILKFFNLIRINSFYYFSEVIDDELIYPPRRETDCPFIPFEDLEMLETPPHFSKTQEIVKKGSRTGVLGRECYGAGEVIWLCLLFETIARSSDNRIMILNLDLFDFTSMFDLSKENLHFIVYNPTDTKIKTRLQVHQQIKRPFSYTIRSLHVNIDKSQTKVTSDKLDKIELELESQSVRIFEVIN